MRPKRRRVHEGDSVLHQPLHCTQHHLYLGE